MPHLVGHIAFKKNEAKSGIFQAVSPAPGRAGLGRIEIHFDLYTQILLLIKSNLRLQLLEVRL